MSEDNLYSSLEFNEETYFDIEKYEDTLGFMEFVFSEIGD